MGKKMKTPPNRIKDGVSRNGRPVEPVRPLNRELEAAIRALQRARQADGIKNRLRLRILRMEDRLMNAYGPLNELCQDVLKESDKDVLSPSDEEWPSDIMEDEADVEVEPLPWEPLADLDFGEAFTVLYRIGLISEPEGG